MSASIARWQLVHMSARASGPFVSYRPHFFSSASCVLVAARSLLVQSLALCGPIHFSLGPWHAAQLTPSSALKSLPCNFSGTFIPWHDVQRALVASMLSFLAIATLSSLASVSYALACRSPPDLWVNSASMVVP